VHVDWKGIGRVEEKNGGLFKKPIDRNAKANMLLVPFHLGESFRRFEVGWGLAKKV
jgi:hypothetical protein